MPYTHDFWARIPVLTLDRGESTLSRHNEVEYYKGWLGLDAQTCTLSYPRKHTVYRNAGSR